MGRVRTKTTKKAARLIVEKYYTKLTLDFHINKKICSEVAVVPSKRLRNKIAGFVTHLMKRIAQGPVRGISLVLQEEERERRDNFVPDKSVLESMVSSIAVDDQTRLMLTAIGYGSLTGLTNSLPAFRPSGPTTQSFPQGNNRGLTAIKA
eukprot:TRINITY_DN928_c0_g1_i3.p1 TRINITY_DN928_c0_g1~~TRINITY_DN928_c0_g1_i3.p1  ORF type:complete len:150 (-),score=17.33 TRINITY_DN928_c0_g1_i3:57-506(-)